MKMFISAPVGHCHKVKQLGTTATLTLGPFQPRLESTSQASSRGAIVTRQVETAFNC